MTNTKIEKQYSKYRGCALALCLSVGFLFTVMAKAEERISLDVHSKYRKGDSIGLKALVNEQYGQGYLKGRKLLYVDVKGESLKRNRKAKVKLIVDGHLQSDEQLMMFLERVRLSNNSRATSAWKLKIAEGPAYIKEVTLVVDRGGEQFYTIRRAHGSYRRGDKIRLKRLLHNEHSVNLENKVLVRVELRAKSRSFLKRAKLALYIGNRRVMEGKVQSFKREWERLHNKKHIRGKKWYVEVTRSSVDIGDIVVVMRKKSGRR